ncbi:MAG: type II secretion system GspH family protein [Anaerohalosphaeraceae bacterium]|nr:type II secretion system GspH family protein [Anaerohalosphaeraceae bacterium]
MRKIRYKICWGDKGFTLIEVVVAMVILTMIAGSVMVVMKRISDAVINWQAKAEAFEISRENMENILAQESVSDILEYGQSEMHPDINWEKRIESFYEPITNRMWIRAVCSAEYFDTEGQVQKVELEHWLSSLSKKQLQQILEQKERQKEYENQLDELDPDQEPEEDPDADPNQEPDTDPEIDMWKDFEKYFGPPPAGYDSWGDVPEEEFWPAVMGP